LALLVEALSEDGSGVELVIHPIDSGDEGLEDLLIAWVPVGIPRIAHPTSLVPLLKGDGAGRLVLHRVDDPEVHPDASLSHRPPDGGPHRIPDHPAFHHPL